MQVSKKMPHNTPRGVFLQNQGHLNGVLRSTVEGLATMRAGRPARVAHATWLPARHQCPYALLGLGMAELSSDLQSIGSAWAPEKWLRSRRVRAIHGRYDDDGGAQHTGLHQNFMPKPISMHNGASIACSPPIGQGHLGTQNCRIFSYQQQLMVSLPNVLSTRHHTGCLVPFHLPVPGWAQAVRS